MVSKRHSFIPGEEFNPFLYIDTGLKLPVGDKSQHYLHFDAGFLSLRVCDQLVEIFKRIQDHMQLTKGKLEGAGYIRRYFFVFDIGVALEITPAGKIIATHEDFDASNINESPMRYSQERVALLSGFPSCELR